jgi:hypothetical protein
MEKSMILFLIDILLILGVFVPGHAQEPDDIASKLVAAKDFYEKKVVEARQPIIEKLNRLENKARDAGNLELVDKVKSERSEFESKGQIPSAVQSSEYVKEIASQRKKLLGAYTAARTAYLKARNDFADEAAKKVDREMKEFEKSIAAPIVVDLGKEAGFGNTIFGRGVENIQGRQIKVGDPQFTLIWDSKADLDLHVIEPGGAELFWNQVLGKFGGFLDVDNVEGFGPENIAWARSTPGRQNRIVAGPNGEYKWYVFYYGGNGGTPVLTRWKVRVKRGNKVEIFTGTLSQPGARSRTYPIQFPESAVPTPPG